MQQSKNQSVELPAEVIGQVNRIDQLARSGRVPPKHSYTANRVTESRTFTSTKTETGGDFDLLFYILTDIPSSFRTLLIDAVSQDIKRDHFGGLGGSYGGAGSSGDYSDNPDISLGNPSSSVGVMQSMATGGAVVVGGAVAYEALSSSGEASISTDDSLGYFS
jgi:hypothetical protein